MKPDASLQTTVFSRVPCFLILLLVLGCMSRFYLLGHESLWLDEAASVKLADKIGRLHIERVMFFSKWPASHPPVYYAALYYWMKLFGASEAALRALSVVFGVLVIVLTYYVGGKCISKETGMVASLLLLVNPVAVYYSQEARMYTITPALVLVSTYFCHKLLSDRRMKHFALYVCASTLLIYTDYLGTLMLAMHALFALIRFVSTRDRKSLRVIIIAYVAIVVLYIPWLPNALVRHNWGLISWMQPPSLSEAVSVALNLLGVGFAGPNAAVNVTGGSLQSILYAMLGIWGGVFFVIGLVVSLREKTSFRALLAMLCFMPLVMILISLTIVPIFNLRQASVYLPEMELVLAVGFLAAARGIRARLAWLPSRAAWLPLMLPLLLASCGGVYRVYSLDTKENWREVARDMEQMPADRPIYICHFFMTTPFNYYYRGSAEVTGLKLDDAPLLGDTASVEELTLIVSHIDPARVLEEIEQDFRVREERPYRGASVYLLKRNRNGNPSG
jgi:uncharacterized membrane protein